MQGKNSHNIRTIVPPYGDKGKTRMRKRLTECWNKGQGKRWQWPGTGGGKRDGEQEPYRKCGQEVK